MRLLDQILGSTGMLLGVLLSATALHERWVRRGGRRRPTAAGGGILRWAVRPFPLLALSILLAVIGGALLLQSGRDDPGAPRETAVRLLRELVSDEAEGCREVGAVGAAVVSLDCWLSPPMTSMRISLFQTVEELEKTIVDRAEQRGLSEGSCATQRFAWESWSEGRLLCDLGDADSPGRLEWSRTDTRVLVEATSGDVADADDIYEWWQRESNGAPSQNRIAYPDGLEEKILGYAGLAPSACTRNEGFKGSTAALWCRLDGMAPVFLALYRDTRALRRTLGLPPGRRGVCVPTGTRGTPQRGRMRYRLEGEEVGTRDCWSDMEKGTSTAEWTNERTSMYGYVATKNTRIPLHRLFRWWQRQGVRLTD